MYINYWYGLHNFEASLCSTIEVYLEQLFVSNPSLKYAMGYDIADIIVNQEKTGKYLTDVVNGWLSVKVQNHSVSLPYHPVAVLKFDWKIVDDDTIDTTMVVIDSVDVMVDYI